LRTDVVGVGFDNVTMDEAVARAMELIAIGKRCYCVTPNSEIVYDCIKNAELRGFINSADLVLPDGAGIILGAKILKTPLKSKVAGVEFALELAKKLAESGGGLFLLGAKPGVAERAAAELKRLTPGLEIAGTMDGYFKNDSVAVEAINMAKPAALYVCLGSPRQENFVRSNLGRLEVGLAVGLGGTLDIYAGDLKRAPKWMIKMSLEWLYRLICQPSRLGRMMRLPKFVFAAFRYRRKISGR